MYSKYLFFTLLLLLPFQTVNAVIINEIAWMGTNISANNEWIELYNESTQEIDLAGWILQATDGAPNIVLQDKIPALGFFLLERTDNETVPNISADQIYQGSLSNAGEKLLLTDNNGQTIDVVDCSAGWLSGNNTTKQTMERCYGVGDIPDPTPTPTLWENSQNPGGTPKQSNSQCLEVGPPNIATNDTPMPTATNTSTAATNQSIDLYANITNIFINEVLASPTGPDADGEWIEFYNANNFEVDLSDWKIRDTIGAVKAYEFPNKTTILANGFLVLTRPQSKITLQNSGDELELLNPQGNIVNNVAFGAASQGQAWARTSDDAYKWTANLTPAKPNTFPETKANKTNQSSEVSPQRINENAIANVKGAGAKFQKPLFNFLIGLAVATISAIIVFILYKKFSPIPPHSNFY